MKYIKLHACHTSILLSVVQMRRIMRLMRLCYLFLKNIYSHFSPENREWLRDLSKADGIPSHSPTVHSHTVLWFSGRPKATGVPPLSGCQGVQLGCCGSSRIVVTFLGLVNCCKRLGQLGEVTG